MMKTLQAVAEITSGQIPLFNETFVKVGLGKAFVAETCLRLKKTNTFQIHHETYEILRKEFGLPAQLAVSANKYACASCKRSVNKGVVPVFKSNSIHYDKRSATINLEKGVASLLTVKGRLKVKLPVNKYFRKFLGWETKEANLVKTKEGRFFLMVSIEKPSVISNKTGKIIGIDRGINNLIATSDGWIYDSQQIWRVKQRYVRLRGVLQSKGTRSAKRHLSKIRGREKRFMRDINHCVSRKLIESAGENGVIVLENLKGIRTAKHRREQHWQFANWAVYQLEQFLAYKGEEFGVAVEFIPSKNTSKTCSACGSLKKGQRQGAIFTCKICRIVLDADFNAARNILHKYQLSEGLLFNQPNAPTVVEQATDFNRQ